MSDYSVVLGLQSTADWSDSNFIPGEWREAILRWFPNGEAPLTAMLAKLPSEVCTDFRFNWWTEGLPVQGGAVAGVYHNAALSTAYTTGDGVAGDVIYCQCTAAVESEFRIGHTAMLRDNDRAGAVLAGKVIGISSNGSSSYVALKILETDDEDASAAYDYLQIIGSMNPQASESPDAISYQPVGAYNYTQIFRTALEIAGTTLATKTRVGDWYQHEKQNALRMHSIEMEKAFLWGIRYLGTGSNGKPEYSTQGLIRVVSTNKYNFKSDTDYAGKTWLQGGKDWLDAMLAKIFKYGSDSRMVYAGTGAILGINQLAAQYGQIQLTPSSAEYGIKVMTWITPFGVIYLKRHPLLSYETNFSNSMFLFEPANLKYRYMKGRDTSFRPDDRLQKGTWTDRDAIKEGWLTEAGLEYGIEPTFGLLNGVGSDNAA
jgi:hypothetical protein